jgi:ribosome-binding protein aMBF1 (putative translation factor)
MAKACSVCGRKFGGFLGFGGVRESEVSGVCESCRKEDLEKKKVKKEKRKKEKIKRAWLYGRR